MGNPVPIYRKAAKSIITTKRLHQEQKTAFEYLLDIITTQSHSLPCNIVIKQSIIKYQQFDF